MARRRRRGSSRRRSAQPKRQDHPKHQKLDRKQSPQWIVPQEIVRFSNLRLRNISELLLENAVSKGAYIMDASKNYLSSLPTNICRCTSLIDLNLSCNQFVRQHALRPVSYLTNLTSLDLSHNRLPTLPDALCALARLRYINVSSTSVRTLPRNFSRLTDLRVVDWSSCRLSSLPPVLLSLTCLDTLRLSVNDLASLPDSISKFTRLQLLDLSHNRIDRIPRCLSSLRSLFSLNLRGNLPRVIPVCADDDSWMYREPWVLPSFLLRMKHLGTFDIDRDELVRLPSTGPHRCFYHDGAPPSLRDVAARIVRKIFFPLPCLGGLDYRNPPPPDKLSVNKFFFVGMNLFILFGFPVHEAILLADPESHAIIFRFAVKGELADSVSFGDLSAEHSLERCCLCSSPCVAHDACYDLKIFVGRINASFSATQNAVAVLVILEVRLTVVNDSHL